MSSLTLTIVDDRLSCGTRAIALTKADYGACLGDRTDIHLTLGRWVWAGCSIVAAGWSGQDRAIATKFGEEGFKVDKLGEVEAVVNPAAFLSGLDELAFFEGFEVEGQLGLADLQGVAEIADAKFLVAQEVNDAETQGIGEGVKPVDQDFGGKIGRHWGREWMETSLI